MFCQQIKSEDIWLQLTSCNQLIWFDMVDLSGGPDSGGPIEHGFSNWVFVVPAIIIIGLIGKENVEFEDN